MEKHYDRPILFTGCKGPGSGLPYLIVSGVWRNFQILHICVTFDKFSALNPGWFINRWDVRGEDACERPLHLRLVSTRIRLHAEFDLRLAAFLWIHLVADSHNRFRNVMGENHVEVA